MSSTVPISVQCFFCSVQTDYLVRSFTYGLGRPVIIRIEIIWMGLYDKSGVIYWGWSEKRLEARASDMGSHPGLW